MHVSERSLHHLFETITTAVLSASLAGCGGSTASTSVSSGSSGSSGLSSSSGGIDTSEWPESLCDGQTYRAVHDVHPASPVDYVDLRQGYTYATGQPARIVDQDGRACIGAHDPLACGAALDAASSTDGWAIGGLGGGAPAINAFLVTTQGDTVSTVTTDPALRALLGPVDNVKKAALVYLLSGHHTVSCGVTRARASPTGGYDFVSDESQPCGGSYRIVTHVSPDATVTEVSRESVGSTSPGPCATGRLTEGLAPHSSDCSRGLGPFFAETAHLEAASVHAFRRLARELRAHGAPAALVQRAKAAAKDEVRHARTTAAIARRYGCAPASPRLAAFRVRSLEAVALENAVEGCVRETFGALLATWQAKAALDPRIRRAMRGIARDETAHAALAWDVARWIEPALPWQARARVTAARSAALATLERELEQPLAREIERMAGMPSSDRRRGLLSYIKPLLAA